MKIQPLNVTNPVNKKSKPNFSGHVLTKDVYGNDIYKFFTPNAIPGVQLEYVIMTHDKDGNYSINKDAEHTKKTVNLPQGFDPHLPNRRLSPGAACSAARRFQCGRLGLHDVLIKHERRA